MCASIAALIRDGEMRGEQKAKEKFEHAEQRAKKEAEQNTVQNIMNVMNDFNLPLSKVMDSFRIPKNMRSKYGKMVKSALAEQSGTETNP